MKLVWGLMALLAVSGLTAATAQRAKPTASTPEVVGKVVECRKVTDADARLRCYDGAVDGLTAAVAGGSIVVVDREDVRKTRRSLFGFTLPALPFFKGDNSQDDAPKEVDAIIKSVRILQNDKYIIELDSGAVWQTLQEASLQQTPRAGQKIKLKSGALGSYRVSVEGRPGIRAMRIR